MAKHGYYRLMSKNKFHIEEVPTIELIPFANNSRTHTDAQVAQIAASITEFGFTNPVIIDSEKNIIAGHGRVRAANKINLKNVPCVTVDGWTKAQKRAYIIADNKLALNAGWDERLLRIELGALAAEEFNLELTGFSLGEIEGLGIEKALAALTDEDEIPAPPENPVSQLGDVWILGEHRLMCGNSTDAASVHILLNGVTPDLVYTDPPYGINEKGDRSNRGGVCEGNNLKDFIDDSTSYAIDAYNICDELGIKRQVWWGANYYCHALPESNNWFVWDKRVEDKQRDTQSDCELAWVKSKWSSVRIFRHLWKGALKGSEHGQKRCHPTQKPVALAEWSFDYFKDAKTVLDLFLGSGSTLIAAEKSSRKCFGMELDPHYADVIINRWQDYTGQKAMHESGKTYASLKKSRK